jgi:putative membrane protein
MNSARSAPAVGADESPVEAEAPEAGPRKRAGRTGPAAPLRPPAQVLAEMEQDATPWVRLDSRVVWVDLVVFVLSLLPTVVTVFVFHLDFKAGPFGIWPALVATTLGVSGSIGDLTRWMKTKYRITDARVEQRKGWLTKRYRYIPRERVRSVDNTAKLRYRLAGLRIVNIGSGETRISLKLDAVSTKTAARLHRDLMRVAPVEQAPAGAGRDAKVGDGVAAAGEDQPPSGPQETVIARLHWSWIWYNLINIWAFLVAALLLWAAFWVLQIINVDLRDIIGKVIPYDRLGTGWSVAVSIGGTFVLGVIGLAVSFVKDNYRFELVRTTTGDGTALLTRQGLLDTREVYRDDRRLRGIHISQPLLWRWCGLTETKVISTGLTGRSASGEPASSILPRAPISEVLRVAREVLPGDERPLEAPLRPHAKAALYRRIVFAAVTPLILSGLLAWFGATGAVPDWLWPIALLLLPIAGILAVVAHRALGHGLVGEYIVLRSGVNRAEKAALDRRAVLSWTVSQSLLQRALGLMSVGAATAAGASFYRAIDLRAGQAVAFLQEISPETVSDFVVPTGGVPAKTSNDPGKTSNDPGKTSNDPGETGGDDPGGQV